jgi:hypothetical protein
MYNIFDHDESDMKDDILSVSKLPALTTRSEIIKVLKTFIEERCLKWKNCLGVCTDRAVCLTGLVTKIKNTGGRGTSYCQCTVTFIGKTWPKKKMASELNEVLSLTVKIINYIKIMFKIQDC